MADAGSRRHHAEIGEGLLAPAQERIALHIAFIFDGDVLLERISAAEIVHHHRVVDHQIDLGQRIDLLRIAAQRLHRVAHRRQIDDRRHAGQVLHQHARRAEGDLAVRSLLGGGQRLDVCGGYRLAVLVAQQVLEQNFQRIRQPGDALKAVLSRPPPG